MDQYATPALTFSPQQPESHCGSASVRISQIRSRGFPLGECQRLQAPGPPHWYLIRRIFRHLTNGHGPPPRGDGDGERAVRDFRRNRRSNR